MSSLSTVLLSIKGELRKVVLQLNEEGNLTIESMMKYFKKKDAPEQVCYYEYDNKIIFIFGYTKGKKGTENKIELPDPYTATVLFGDAIVVVSPSHKWETPMPYTVDQWNVFYNNMNGAVDEESIDSSDSSDNELVSNDGGSVKDEFADEEEEKTSIVDIEEEDHEEVPQVIKKRRAPIYNKIDPTALKEHINIKSEPETNTLRMLCISNLKFLEANFSGESIRELEQAIFEAAYNYAVKNYIARNWKSPLFIEIYRQVLRGVLSNIHPESPVKNPRLMSRILDGELKLSDVPPMSAYEMFPEKWFTLKDKLLQREQKILEGNKSRATDQFKCRRCQKRECTYYELQTRSADEPMTIFITCLNCGKEWRQGG